MTRFPHSLEFCSKSREKCSQKQVICASLSLLGVPWHFYKINGSLCIELLANRGSLLLQSKVSLCIFFLKSVLSTFMKLTGNRKMRAVIEGINKELK